MEESPRLLKKYILSTLKELELSEKALRKTVFSMFGENECPNKKVFTQCLQSLVTNNKVELNDGMYKKPVKVSKKRKLSKIVDNDEDNLINSEDEVQDFQMNNNHEVVENNVQIFEETGENKKKTVMGELWKYGEVAWRDGVLDQKYIQSNPDRITRLFCGNLNKKITEEQLKNALPGITHIKWITDKVTKEFYGSTFIEMKDPESAAVAVLMDKSKLLGRPLKIYYCPPRPGDKWPPSLSLSIPNPNPNTIPSLSLSSSTTANTSTSNNQREPTVKPIGCKKLYCGNLSYEIDDDSMVAFFETCGEIVGLRWLTQRDTGAFRGCGFIQFATSEAADEAMKLNGRELLGRPIRLDWTE
eukprot:CAMPEP_0182420870 /NCGR_PEP_ID=MMETSP1167-20130531/5951_1 /TAXON_ID=2988 /ORGANISM="Mallomonas Sp, Strain CCMP3275" /LENGTH=357 /DNA_ID=CAMNT_0024597383 /DNA_START=37 /DNA_END=1110 /DNA_ORIENTATION=+